MPWQAAPVQPLYVPHLDPYADLTAAQEARFAQPPVPRQYVHPPQQHPRPAPQGRPPYEERGPYPRQPDGPWHQGPYPQQPYGEPWPPHPYEPHPNQQWQSPGEPR